MSVAVIGRTLLGIDQHRISFGNLLELVFRIRIVRIPIRMVLHGEFAVGALDLVLGATPLDSQHLVIVGFGRSHTRLLYRAGFAQRQSVRRATLRVE